MHKKNTPNDILLRLTPEQRKFLTDELLPPDDPLQTKLRFALADGGMLAIKIVPQELITIFGAIFIAGNSERKKSKLKLLDALAKTLLQDHEEILMRELEANITPEILEEMGMDEDDFLDDDLTNDIFDREELLERLAKEDLPFPAEVVVGLLSALFPSIRLLELGNEDASFLETMPPQYLYLNDGVTDPEIETLPLMRAMKLFLSLLEEAGAVPLNKDGTFPQDFLRKYLLAFPKEFMDPQKELLQETTLVETAFLWPFVVRALAQMNSWTKKRKGALSITKAGKSFLHDMTPGVRLAMLFRALFSESAATLYFDEFPEVDLIQASIPYTIAVFSQMDTKWKDVRRQLPKLLLPDIGGELDEFPREAVVVMTLARVFLPLNALGLLEVEAQLNDKIRFRKTEFFSRFIVFAESPPRFPEK